MRQTKRLSQWVASADIGYTALAGGASAILQSNATLINTTIVRTRGVLSIGATGTGADATPIGALGMGIVSDQAFAAGAASIPGPWTDQDWEGWFVWIPWAFKFEVTTDVGRLLSTVQIEINSKAMRKVGANETVVMMMESQQFATEVHAGFRMLVKLSR